MAYLGDPKRTIEILNKYHIVFQKKFGQNFLIDTHVLDKIIVELEALPDDTDKFYDYCVKKYKDEVPTFNPKSYGF